MLTSDFGLNNIRLREKYLVDPSMVNKQLENKLQAFQLIKFYKYVMILCVCIFTIVIFDLSQHIVYNLYKKESAKYKCEEDNIP